MSDFTILLGSTGAGAWASHDGGATWQLSSCDDPWFPYEYDVRALSVDPHDPHVVWVGLQGDEGEDVIAVSHDAGSSYRRAAATGNRPPGLGLGGRPPEP